MERRVGLRAHAEAQPDRPAIIDDRGVLNYGDLHLRVNRLAIVFAAL